MREAPGRRVRLLIVCVFALCALLAAGNADALARVVPTDRGPVRGSQDGAVDAYLGIPYAAPPVGALRWQPPRPVERWQTPRDATQFANHCSQPASIYGVASTTEDCLYLNVYAPDRGDKGHTKDLPVMFWIHGGGLTVGESDDYDPTRLVEQGTVVVTINYRLGLLGFLAHPALSSGSGYGGSGNYGLMDQQAALRWVQRNIRKFGGDPDDVTIFGQSAGGLSVHSQLASPRAAGLFDRAVAQSGSYAENVPTLTEAEDSGQVNAENLTCPDQTAECLRSLPVQTILDNQPAGANSILPNVDGRVLTRNLGDAFTSGDFNRVPVIEGSTHDEFSIFAATNIELEFGIRLGDLPAFFYPVVVGSLVGTLGLNRTAPEVVAEYPLERYNDDVGEALTAIGTDALFSCPARRIAGLLSQHVPTHTYDLNDPAVPQPFVKEDISFPLKTYHASDLLFLFDSDTFGGEFGGHAPFTPSEESLAAAMVRYWTQFARAGDPNSAETPFWPAYDTTGDVYQLLEPPEPRTTAGFATDHHCAFWDAG